MAEQKIKKNKRRIAGVVVNNKMSKTLVVKVTHSKFHPKYRKQYVVSKKYKVHDGKALAKIGDQIVFEECRPLSKDKKWRLISIVK
jgi:small subunit ribosomal protein S17